MTAGPDAAASPTPILDREVPLPPPVAPGSGSRFAIGLGIVLAAALFVALVVWNPPGPRRWIEAKVHEWFPEPWTAARFLAVVAVILLVAVATMAIHEGGHALAGIAVGFRFQSLRLGPLLVDRRLRVTWYRGSGAASSGWASMLPGELGGLRARTLALVAGGPAANFLSAAVVYASTAGKGFGAWLFVFSSVLAGLVDLLPFRTRISDSDGKRIGMLLRKEPRGERWLALLRLTAELRSGTMPESLSADAIARAIAVRDDSPDTVTAHAIAFASAFHRRKDAEAAGLLEVCLRQCGHVVAATREALVSDAAVFQGRRRRRADRAREWLALMPERTQTPWLRPRVEAAILEAEGDVAGAARKLDEVERAVRALPDEVLRGMLGRGIDRWRRELRGS